MMLNIRCIAFRPVFSSWSSRVYFPASLLSGSSNAHPLTHPPTECDRQQHSLITVSPDVQDVAHSHEGSEGKA